MIERKKYCRELRMSCFSVFLLFRGLVKMKLRLNTVSVALAALALRSQSAVSALRSGSESSMRVVDSDGGQAVVWAKGEQTFFLRAANETASFRCGENLILLRPFKGRHKRRRTQLRIRQIPYSLLALYPTQISTEDCKARPTRH